MCVYITNNWFQLKPRRHTSVWFFLSVQQDCIYRPHCVFLYTTLLLDSWTNQPNQTKKHVNQAVKAREKKSFFCLSFFGSTNRQTKSSSGCHESVLFWIAKPIKLYMYLFLETSVHTYLFDFDLKQKCIEKGSWYPTQNANKCSQDKCHIFIYNSLFSRYYSNTMPWLVLKKIKCSCNIKSYD